MVTALANGIATVRAVSVEDETVFDEIEIVIGTTGTDKFDQNTVKLYPNPVTDFVQIETSEAIKEVIVINALGQQIRKGNSNKIDFSGYSTGVYIIKISLENNMTHTQKLIKK